MRNCCLVLALIVTSCSVPASKYENVSHEKRFQGLLGSRKFTKSEFLVLGIDSYPSQRKTKYFLLVPQPGFEGPEVLSRASLPAGAEVKIIGAEACTNCGNTSERFLVEVVGLDADKPVYLNTGFIDELSRHQK